MQIGLAPRPLDIGITYTICPSICSKHHSCAPYGAPFRTLQLVQQTAPFTAVCGGAQHRPPSGHHHNVHNKLQRDGSPPLAVRKHSPINLSFLALTRHKTFTLKKCLTHIFLCTSLSLTTTLLSPHTLQNHVSVTR